MQRLVSVLFLHPVTYVPFSATDVALNPQMNIDLLEEALCVAAGSDEAPQTKKKKDEKRRLQRRNWLV